MKVIKENIEFDLNFFQVGDKLPSVQVMEGTPNDKVNVASLFAGKKGVLFAVPGAFTPGCSKVGVLLMLINHSVGYKYSGNQNWLTGL